jgi:serine/threonine protein kinase
MAQAGRARGERRERERLPESADGPPPARFRVELVSGKVLALPLHRDGPTLFGRAPECDRRIHSLFFSQRHFMTMPIPDGYLLMDLRGRNGTLLGGRRVRIARLREGDVVRAGPHLLVFSGGGDERPTCPGCERRLSDPSKGVCLVCRHRYELIGRTVCGVTVESPLRDRFGHLDYLGTKDGRPVRLRVLEGTASRRMLKKLRRFEHPRAVRIRATGYLDGATTLVTSVPSSVTLTSLVQTHVPPPAGLVTEVMRGTAEALATAHRAGLVHGAIRPGCVGIHRAGKARLDDLGLRNLLPHGEPAETDWFRPPEHRDAPRRAEIVDDVYAFGATFYVTLTRRAPLPDFAHGRSTIARPLQEVRPDLPARVCEVIERCLDPDPNKRYLRFHAILEALE